MAVAVFVSEDPEENFVGEGEILYRRVLPGQYQLSEVDGTLRIYSSAFNDQGYKPSVDREALCGGALSCKKQASDGILALITREVRRLSVPASPDQLGNVQSHSIDVKARPIFANNQENLPENLAHAQIEADPAFLIQSRFRKLKEALALLAARRGWAAPPIT
jgi:hypothetical protein